MWSIALNNTCIEGSKRIEKRKEIYVVDLCAYGTHVHQIQQDAHTTYMCSMYIIHTNYIFIQHTHQTSRFTCNLKKYSIYFYFI